MTTSVSIDLQNTCDADGVPDDEKIHDWVVGTLLAANAAKVGGFELAVRLVGEDESQALNMRYRQQDKPTNVLSFPFDDLAGLPAAAIRPLGDLVICAPVVEREAREQGKKVVSHWMHMVVHGTLHLLGYDHQDEEQAASMEGLETKILQEFGIENPYLET